MRLKLWLVLLGLVLLAGCVVVMDPFDIALTTTFDSAEVAFIHDEGTATIQGSAFIRQRGGGVVNCAGEPVSLIPSGAYARERKMILYGTTTSPGYRNFSENAFGGKMPEDAPAQYFTYARATRCDVDGRFEFKNVAPGSYFVTTTITWTVGRIPQGGYLMAPVTIHADDDNISVVLSP